MHFGTIIALLIVLFFDTNIYRAKGLFACYLSDYPMTKHKHNLSYPNKRYEEDYKGR